MSIGRGERFGLVLDLIDWLDGRQAPFGVAEVAEAIEMGTRTAWRYLDAAEARGLVEVVRRGHFSDRKSGKTLWESRVRKLHRRVAG